MIRRYELVACDRRGASGETGPHSFPEGCPVTVRLATFAVAALTLLTPVAVMAGGFAGSVLG